VTDKKGNFGFINEVSINENQIEPEHQISYAVHWIIGNNTTVAWFNHDDLFYHFNIFIEFAKAMVENEEYIQPLFNAMDRKHNYTVSRKLFYEKTI